MTKRTYGVTVQRYCPAFREDHAILVQNLLITDTVAVLLGHFPMKTGPHGQLSHPQYKLISTPDLFAAAAGLPELKPILWCDQQSKTQFTVGNARDANSSKCTRDRSNSARCHAGTH